MTSKIMTAEQAFNVSMNTYPSLYSAPTLEMAKDKFYDHIFNTIGNGYRDTEEFLHGHTINKSVIELMESFPEKYIGNTPLYTAYTAVDNSRGLEMPVHDSILEGLYTKEELETMPHVATSIQSNSREFDDDREGIDDKFSPYPNFKKTYSMVWNMDMNAIGKSWIEAGIVYYEHMRNFFNSEKYHWYSGAIPKDEVDLEIMVSDYEKMFKHYTKEDMTEAEYFKAISDAYEIEYTGDTEQFIRNRWDKELARIHAFIDETILMLKAL